MQITWLGQSCFKIQDKEAVIVTDPYSPQYGLKLPRLKADIITVSHQHEDHNYIEKIKGITQEKPFIIDNEGEYEVRGIFVQGLKSWHDSKEGAERGKNIIYYFRLDNNLTVVHLGDLGVTKLSNDQMGLIEGVDILMIPVGGVFTINAAQAAQVISEIEPRVVIPMHYQIPGLKIKGGKTKLDPIDEFTKEMGVKQADAQDKLKIAKKDLPQDDMKVVLLKPEG